MAQRSFSREFNAHWAVQLIISTAGHAGTPIRPDDLAPGLAREYPEFSAAELTRMLCAAAIDAGVVVAQREMASATRAA